jgi:DNA helicase-2/ATP-dependent DNA helicase PcrA
MHTSAAKDELLSNLNEPQRQAVVHRDGPLLVLAGPGSGKTRIITRRAAFLVHTGVRPQNVLAITFTNKAAEEMKKRIEALGVGRGMWVHTFHALGARLLREFGPMARVQAGFSIYDEDDRLRVVKEAMELCNVSDTRVRPEAVQAEISSAKSKLLTPTEFQARAESSYQREVAPIYEAYEQFLEQRNAVDFDDLLMRVAQVLELHPEVTERLNIRFRYVLIDEYQDTNHAQYLIARKLSQHHRNICATGDPDQSIYGWRGADIRNILEFERDYPDATVVRLEQNYRSTGHILKVASKLIRANRHRKHKELWSKLPAGAAVRAWRFSMGDDEAERIGDTIRELHAAGRPYSDFAIFYRINAISRGLEESLRNRAIPYKIARGVEFYSRREIKDLVAYLRLLVNPADDVALLRVINVPGRGIGKTTIDRIVAYAGSLRRPLSEVVREPEQIPGLKSAAGRVRQFADRIDRLKSEVEGKGVSAAVSHVLAATGLEAMLKEEDEVAGEDRLANVQEFVTAAAKYEEQAEEPALAEFLSRVALVSDQDQVNEQAGVVMLMTLHAAKGLEFPVVFLVGLEQGLLPHERALRDSKHASAELEEERRLCFVGITRAREELFITHARERLVRGTPMPRAASQFLKELDDGETEFESFEQPGFGGAPGGWGDDEFFPEDGFAGRDRWGRRGRGPGRTRGGQRGRDARSGGRDRGFVPEFEDDASRLTRSRRAAPPTSPAPRGASPYAGWVKGTLVKHDRYGVGQVVWIRPGDGQTRASIRFAGYGEKTFVLELAPVRKLER